MFFEHLQFHEGTAMHSHIIARNGLYKRKTIKANSRKPNQSYIKRHLLGILKKPRILDIYRHLRNLSRIINTFFAKLEILNRNIESEDYLIVPAQTTQLWKNDIEESWVKYKRKPWLAIQVLIDFVGFSGFLWYLAFFMISVFRNCEQARVANVAIYVVCADTIW